MVMIRHYQIRANVAVGQKLINRGGLWTYTKCILYSAWSLWGGLAVSTFKVNLFHPAYMYILQYSIDCGKLVERGVELLSVICGFSAIFISVCVVNIKLSCVRLTDLGPDIDSCPPHPLPTGKIIHYEFLKLNSIRNKMALGSPLAMEVFAVTAMIPTLT